MIFVVVSKKTLTLLFEIVLFTWIISSTNLLAAAITASSALHI